MVAVLTALALAEPFATLLLVLIAYLASIPLAMSSHRRLLQQRPLAGATPTPTNEADADHF